MRIGNCLSFISSSALPYPVIAPDQSDVHLPIDPLSHKHMHWLFWPFLAYADTIKSYLQCQENRTVLFFFLPDILSITSDGTGLGLQMSLSPNKEG